MKAVSYCLLTTETMRKISTTTSSMSNCPPVHSFLHGPWWNLWDHLCPLSQHHKIGRWMINTEQFILLYVFTAINIGKKKLLGQNWADHAVSFLMLGHDYEPVAECVLFFVWLTDYWLSDHFTFDNFFDYIGLQIKQVLKAIHIMQIM